MLFVLTLAFLAAANALSLPPTHWGPKKISILVDAALPASQYIDPTTKVPGVIGIPEGVFNMTQITITNHQNMEFKLCLKQGVAPPVLAGQQNWDNALYCDLYHFTNGTKSTTVYSEVSSHRLRSINDQLRGSGSSVSNNDRSFGAVAAHHVRRMVTSQTVGGEGHIQLKNLRAGQYYATIAVIGVKKGNFTVDLEVDGFACPQAGQDGYNNCRNLGAIVDGQPQMFPDIDMWASAMYGDWDKINAETASVTVSANLINPTVNTTAMIYGRWGALPTSTIYDFMLPALIGVQTQKATLNVPQAAMWYFGVHNPNGAAFPASVNVTVSRVQCDKGKMGPDCKTKFNTLPAADAAASLTDVKKGDMLYFEYYLNKTALTATEMKNSVAFAAAALEGDVVPKVYARYGMIPTPTEFDLVDCTTGNCKEQATLLLPEDDVMGDKKWYILVIPQGDKGVVVWNAKGGACANKCGGDNQGTCDTKTATCTCKTDFESFDCSVSKNQLERWEWALIIGGAVLIAIGLIGCIVFFIQKQQRRAGFERV